MASFQKYKTKNGEKWLFKMYVGIDPLTGKNKPTTRRGFKTKKEAQSAASQLQQDVEGGLNSKNPTFENVFNEWWAVHSKTIKPSTQYKKKSIFKKHIIPRFGKLRIKDISKSYCQKVINQIAKDTDSIQDIKIQANLVFKYALSLDYILKNPMEYVIIPKKEEEFLANDKDHRNFWTKSEITSFLSMAKVSMSFQDYVMFYVMIYTGIRKGEFAALEWKDIDFKGRQIKINKTMFFEEGKEIIQTAKTHKAKRTIDIDDEDVVSLLNKLRVYQKEMLLANGISTDVHNILIRADLRPIRLAHPNDVLNRFIHEHKLHRITIHGLRHTHASLLFAAGAEVVDVKARLGHRQIQTTWNIYTHVTKERKTETTKALRKYMES